MTITTKATYLVQTKSGTRTGPGLGRVRGETMTLQRQMKARLEQIGIPAKEIEVYGSQIVITSWSEGAARKWAVVLARFSTVHKAALKTFDEDKRNTGSQMNPSVHTVWRTFATI